MANEEAKELNIGINRFENVEADKFEMVFKEIEGDHYMKNQKRRTLNIYKINQLKNINFLINVF